MATIGGKNRLASAAGLILESFKTVFVESYRPFAHVFFGDTDTTRDFDQVQPAGHAENDTSATNRPSWKCGASNPPLKFRSFFWGQIDP